MDNIYKYSLFISYATKNKEIAEHIVSRIEKNNYKCFIAPRDIPSGSDYASEIVRAISNSKAVLLIFSSDADKSGYVLREINSAISRNKTIIPLRIEKFLPSEAMEFYLGPTHWLDAFPEILDAHLESVYKIVNSINSPKSKNNSDKDYYIDDISLMEIKDLPKINSNYQKMVMREIELDYLCIPSDKFNMNDDIEGTFNDWLHAANEYEEDTSILLVKNDEIIGYCDCYPITNEAYKNVIDGKVIIREDMIDIYYFGGEFNAYIAMISIDPVYASQKTYMMFFKWLVEHINEWAKNNIIIKNIGISVYSPLLEKFVQRFGFNHVGFNPANGKIYESTCSQFINNKFLLEYISRI